MTTEQIKEVQDYFRSRIFTGKFEIAKSEQFWIITIDGVYKFVVYANFDMKFATIIEGVPDVPNFMDLELAKEQKQWLYSIMSERCEAQAREDARIERLAKYEEPKTEFEPVQ